MADINMMKEIIRGFGSCGKFSSSKWMNSVVYVTPPLLLLSYNLRQRRKGKFKLIDLPDDVIVDILTRLPIKSLCCILCASKTFSNRVDSPLFATLHMSRLLNSGINSVAEEPPQLLLFSRPVGNVFNEIHLQPLKYNLDKFDLAKPNYNLLVSKINLTPRLYEVGFVYFNLFFFKGLMHHSPCFLLNPHKEEVLRIPTTAVRGDIVYEDWYGMGFDDTTNTHKIVYVNITKSNQAVTHVYELGRQSSCSWRQIQAVPPCCLSNKKLCSNGDMHWLVNGTRSTDTTERGRSHIISFDFKKDEFCYTPHPTFEKFDLDDFQLVNLKGSIALVRTSFENDVEIWVMKNYIKKEWSLDYKMSIQIERRRPVSNCGEWKNGIFFELDNGDMMHCRPSVYYFMDLQHNSIKHLVRSWSGVDKITFSYTGSLISLKDYGDLVQTTIEGTVWS